MLRYAGAEMRESAVIRITGHLASDLAMLN